MQTQRTYLILDPLFSYCLIMCEHIHELYRYHLRTWVCVHILPVLITNLVMYLHPTVCEIYIHAYETHIHQSGAETILITVCFCERIYESFQFDLTALKLYL